MIYQPFVPPVTFADDKNPTAIEMDTSVDMFFVWRESEANKHPHSHWMVDEDGRRIEEIRHVVPGEVIYESGCKVVWRDNRRVVFQAYGWMLSSVATYIAARILWRYQQDHELLSSVFDSGQTGVFQLDGKRVMRNQVIELVPALTAMAVEAEWDALEVKPWTPPENAVSPTVVGG